MAHVIASEVETRRLRRFEYDRMVDLGMFEGERLELLDGLLVVREPQKSPHATAVRLVIKALEPVFGAHWDVRSQLPFALDDDSEPEPDVVVVPGGPRDYTAAHPSRCALLVEVADGSLLFDQRKKAVLYARAGIADFWIVNLVDNVVGVSRQPVASSSAPYGWRYASVVIARVPDAITPLAAPHARVAVTDLLP